MTVAWSWVAPTARIVTLPLVALLRPVGRAASAALSPLQRRLGTSAVGLAGVAAWQQAGALAARLDPAFAQPPGDQRRNVRVTVAMVTGSLALLVASAATFAVSDPGVLATASTRAAAGVQLPPPPVAADAVDTSSMAKMVASADQQQSAPLHLPQATAAPAPAPPSLADEPPLQPHEVFGFAPYWTLSQSTGFDVNGLTTIAYFSIGVQRRRDAGRDRFGLGRLPEPGLRQPGDPGPRRRRPRGADGQLLRAGDTRRPHLLGRPPRPPSRRPSCPPSRPRTSTGSTSTSRARDRATRPA